MSDSNHTGAAIYWYMPQPLGLERPAIEAIAATVARQLGYWPGEALDNILLGLGGKLDPKPAPGTPTLEVRPSGFVIALPAGESDARMAVAQNLGHYILHVLYQRQRRGTDVTHLRVRQPWQGPNEKPARREAADFATALLMPEAAFTKEWARQRGRLPAVADHFRVTTAQAQARAVQLSLLTQAEAA